MNARTLRLLTALLLAPACAGAQGLIIDHHCTDISQVPDAWINQVKSGLRVHYAHTSHGSQLITGASVLESQDARFGMDVGYTSLPAPSGNLCVFDGQETETYITPDLYWESAAGLQLTRDVLNHNPTINVSMWAWCGQVGYYTSTQISNYLRMVSSLETQFPNVVFVYMTGHLDASGVNGTLHRQNEMIRDYCRRYNKVLYDFGDIGRYDPDGTDYLPLGGGAGDDECAYDGGNWGTEWCAANPGSPLCADCSCAHSQPLNCGLKGRAMWWLLARIAGWTGTGDSPDPVAPGDWYLEGTTDGSMKVQYGYPGTYPVTGDFDHDGVLDFGVYAPANGQWNVHRSHLGPWQTQFGFPGTYPVAADFDADGRCDIGVYHPPTAMWYLYRTTRGSRQFAYGFPGTYPVWADFDRDGRYDFGVYHPPTAMWYIHRTTRGALQVQYGYPGTLPFAADLDNDGRPDRGVYEPATGSWNAFLSSGGPWSQAYGFPGTWPATGDFDGDGAADFGVYYPGP